jgi:phosphorylcholine metabolism protein LicD
MDSWNCVTKENLNEKIQRTEKYKPLLLKMVIHVQDILAEYKKLHPDFGWFLSDGSLLGALRDGKIIPHDYDADMGIIHNPESLSDLYEFIKKNLDTNYLCKIIATYSYKIEVYDPSSGIHSDVAADFYNVIMDLQLYSIDPLNPDNMIIHYYKDNFNNNVYKTEWFMPFGKILFEGFEFPCPKEPIKFLEENYGYIGADNAEYDKTTHKYIHNSQ